MQLNSTQLDLSTLGEYLRLNFPGTELAIFAFAQLMAEFLLIIISEFYLSHNEFGTIFCYFSLSKFKQKLSDTVWLSTQL